MPSEDHILTTQKTIEYLIDCGIDKNNIIEALSSQEDYSSEEFSFEDLPDFLWKDSLLKKNTYYIHHELHLNKNADVLDVFSENLVHSSNAIEMKIIYTIQDVLSYFCISFGLQSENLNREKEFGAIQYLLDIFSQRFKDFNAIDILLYLIDETANADKKYYNILDMQNDVYPTIERLTIINNDLIYNKTNRIIWR